MWTVKIKTLNKDVIVAVLIAISTIANKPGFIWKKKTMLCPNAWVFIAQMVEHCSATRHGFEYCWSPDFFRVYLQLLKL